MTLSARPPCEVQAMKTSKSDYQRSGRVSWLRFVPATIGVLVVSAGMAICWHLARRVDLGFWVITPLLLSLPIAIASYLAVLIGHCRNRPVAATLGVIAAAVFCAGAWHAEMVRLQGPAALTRIDLLPRFMAQEVAADAGLGPGRFLPRDHFFNWAFVTTEWLAIVVVVAGLAVYRSTWGYCESCRRWTRSILLTVDRGIAEEIADGLRHRDWQAIPVTVGRGPFVSNSDSLEFEYCPGLTEKRDNCAAYLTLKAHPGDVTGFPRVLIRQRRLDTEELDALGRRVRALAFLRVSAPSADEMQSSSPALDRHAGSVAAFERLPDSAGGAGLDRCGKIEFMLGLSIVIAGLIGIGLIVLGAVRIDWNVPFGSPLDLCVFAFGVAITLAACIVGVVNIDFPGMRYANRWIRRVIAERPDALVGADSPDAIFVDVVPRAQWHQIIPDKAADRGLLLLDHQRGRVLFEGAKERYVIPVEAVLSSKVVPMMPHTGNWNFYAMVLTVRYPAESPSSLTGGRRDDEWEIPFLARPTRFRRYSTAARRELADTLLASIELLLEETQTKR